MFGEGGGRRYLAREEGRRGLVQEEGGGYVW